jgi:hypothetical protein
MRQFKVHFIAIILAFFTLGSVAGAAMAHCGHDSFTSGDALSMEMSDQNDKADASACGTHDHGSVSATESASSHSSGHGANPVDCDDCSGVPCQSQIQIPQGVATLRCIDSDELHSRHTIHFKNISLSIIPDPPKVIS